MYFIVSLIILIILSMLFWPILFNRFNFSRSNDMKKFAEELGLSYTREEQRSFFQKISFKGKKQNIIEGNLNGENILIYDAFTYLNYPVGECRTFTVINDVFYRAYLPVEEINSVILNLKDRKLDPEKYNFLKHDYLSEKKLYEGDVRKVKFNERLFVIFILSSGVIGLGVYVFLVDKMKIRFIFLIILIAIALWIFIGYFISKRAGYVICAEEELL